MQDYYIKAKNYIIITFFTPQNVSLLSANFFPKIFFNVKYMFSLQATAAEKVGTLLMYYIV